jgi:hypothetical protein
MNAMVIPRTTSSETNRRIGMVCGAVVVVTVLLVTEVAMLGSVSAALKECRAANLATMRGSIIWFALAVGWGIDCLLALFHHNRLQATLTAFFACCFLAAGLILRKREQRTIRR